MRKYFITALFLALHTAGCGSESVPDPSASQSVSELCARLLCEERNTRGHLQTCRAGQTQSCGSGQCESCTYNGCYDINCSTFQGTETPFPTLQADRDESWDEEQEQEDEEN